MTPTAIHEELSAPAYRGDLCDLLEHMRELVETARSMPLSNSAIVNRDEVLELLDETMERLPEERHVPIGGTKPRFSRMGPLDGNASVVT